jgi:hypothetical protein
MSVRLSNMPGEDTYIRFEVLHESPRPVQRPPQLKPHFHIMNPMERRQTMQNAMVARISSAYAVNAFLLSSLYCLDSMQSK